MKYYLAIDLGASSGRHIIGCKINGEIVTKEVYRFQNGFIKKDGSLVWDVERLFAEIKNGIKEAFSVCGKIESLAIDTWGVDYVLLDGDREILPCYAYRDGRTEVPIKKINQIISPSEQYEKTGCAFQPFNTIYQLYDDLLKGRLDNATDFLNLPEYFSYKLTSVKKKEYTIASTTGLINAETKQFDKEMISALRLPERLFKTVQTPPFFCGYLTEEIQKEVGGNTKVLMCAGHDTASAFEAVDARDSIILSSGTWSLLGVKLDKPITNEKALNGNFTNEGGVGYIRFLKNIMGLWIVQNLSKQYAMSFKEMENQAEKSTYAEVFDVNDRTLLAPDDMEKAIVDLLKKENKPLPKTKEDVLYSVFHSLAAFYKESIDKIEEVTGRTYGKLYIIGGGAKNDLLNDLTAFYTKKTVVALPIEATSIGNLKLQIRFDQGE